MKKKDYMVFYHDTHVYMNSITLKKYQSVTTFLGNNSPKFVATAKNTAYTCLLKGMNYDQVVEMWAKNAQDSRELGSYIHEVLEWAIPYNANKNKLREYVGLMDQKVEFIDLFRYYDFCRKFYRKLKLHPDHKLMPEDLLWNDGLQLAGQSDMVILEPDGLTIVDYKTNRKCLTYKSYNNQMMYGAFKEYTASDLSKYELQLNIYAAMASAYYQLPIKGLYVLHLYDKCKVHKFDIYEHNKIWTLLNSKLAMGTVNVPYNP